MLDLWFILQHLLCSVLRLNSDNFNLETFPSVTVTFQYFQLGEGAVLGRNRILHMFLNLMNGKSKMHKPNKIIQKVF